MKLIIIVVSDGSGLKNFDWGLGHLFWCSDWVGSGKFPQRYTEACMFSYHPISKFCLPFCCQQNYSKFCHTRVCVRERPSVCMSITFTSSLSFEAKELKFCTQTPHLNAKNNWNFVFGLSQGTQASVRPSLARSYRTPTLWHIYMRSLSTKFQLSGFKTKGRDRGDRQKDRQHRIVTCGLALHFSANNAHLLNLYLWKAVIWDQLMHFKKSICMLSN